MNRQRTIPVMNQVDIHAARMYTREAARFIGLELAEQAQVSLATSALAECLKMGRPAPAQAEPPEAVNQIIIQVIGEESHGLRVIFESQQKYDAVRIQEQLNRARSFVDDIQVEPLSNGSLRVIMTKWGRHAVAKTGQK